MGRALVEDPLKTFRWKLLVDGFVRFGFSEMSGLKTDIEVVTYAEGGTMTDQKSPGRVTYEAITMKRGKLALAAGAGSQDFENWTQQVAKFGVLGQPGEFRRTIELVLISNDGTDDRRFVVVQAWPSTLVDVPALAASSENMIEELVIQNEGYFRVA